VFIDFLLMISRADHSAIDGKTFADGPFPRCDDRHKFFHFLSGSPILRGRVLGEAVTFPRGQPGPFNSDGSCQRPIQPALTLTPVQSRNKRCSEYRFTMSLRIGIACRGNAALFLSEHTTPTGRCAKSRKEWDYPSG
jgi:hypothetical protein